MQMDGEKRRRASGRCGASGKAGTVRTSKKTMQRLVTLTSACWRRPTARATRSQVGFGKTKQKRELRTASWFCRRRTAHIASVTLLLESLAILSLIGSVRGCNACSMISNAGSQLLVLNRDWADPSPGNQPWSPRARLTEFFDQTLFSR